MRAVVVHLLVTAALAVACVPGVVWLAVLADEVRQENSRAAGWDATPLGWDFVVVVGALPVLGLAAVTAGAVALVRRSRVPTWRVPAVATVASAAAVLHAGWVTADGPSASARAADVEVATALAVLVVVAGLVAVAVAVSGVWRADPAED